ncbi:UNVERIFIED_CONTAM: putative late blight resistance proteinR1B-8 [Sesamum calycinum]|uniref:Late blight resistance proteinR1B-8 n=1 Tax=Sesamum calycinum TaxID=2727403 RepID=A0AAW2PR08_9LAMI
MENKVWSVELEMQHMMQKIFLNPTSRRNSFKSERWELHFLPPDLEKVIEELDSAKEEMMMTIMNSSQTADSSSPAVSSSRQDPNPKNIIVGVGEDLIQLKDRLTGQPSNALQVIPIVGMGGIGKTTLAQNLYDDPFVISHFDTRAWVTISQDYNKQKLQHVLLSLLSCVIGKPKDEMLGMSNDQLALRLHQALKGRRYLIILDDMWDVKPWDDTSRFFPDENNGSRIIVTTRESSVADYTGSGSSHHQMNLLKDDESWNLLHQKVFAPEDTCSPELEKVGKKIAKDCRGLPLSIHVIGGILSQAKTSQDFWEQVSDNVSSTVADKGESFSNILSLSYNHLPNHLKPCFLYMGTFPEDYEIHSSRLINLLVAEGFVRPISDKSLEEAAKMHLKALVDRNLISVHQQKTNGNVKSYSIHDLLRDLCVRKAHEEKFLFVDRWADNDLGRSTSCWRRVCYHGPFSTEDAYILTEQIRLARSFLLFDRTGWSVASPVVSNLRLLRVLDILRITFHQFPEEILQLVNLRYLAFNLSKPLPSSISRLCNLQTLIAQWRGLNMFVSALMMFQEPDIVIRGILDMTQLRHIKVKGQKVYVRYHGADRNRYVILDKLQTLSPVAISEISDRKLTLRGCRILDHHHVNEIGKLPCLEILKLRDCDFKTGKWEAEDAEFCQLQFLLMEDLRLVNWAADDTHFPRLEHLVIRRCRYLEEIPLAIGDIPTLKVSNRGRKCNPSAVASAREIQQAQLDNGNDYLQVRITQW